MCGQLKQCQSGREIMGVSFDKIDGVIWYDGRLVPWADANVHVLTHGLHYASCVFEGERAYGGKVFKSTEHSERLRRSAQILDFEIPYSVAEIDAAKALVIEKNNRPNAYVRPVARGGFADGPGARAFDGRAASPAGRSPTVSSPASRVRPGSTSPGAAAPR